MVMVMCSVVLCWVGSYVKGRVCVVDGDGSDVTFCFPFCNVKMDDKMKGLLGYYVFCVTCSFVLSQFLSVSDEGREEVIILQQFFFCR